MEDNLVAMDKRQVAKIVIASLSVSMVVMTQPARISVPPLHHKQRSINTTSLHHVQTRAAVMTPHV